MGKIGKTLFIALEISSYLALAICLFMIFSFVFFGEILFLPDGTIAMGTRIIFGSLGVLLGLRRIHHIKTMRLRAESRFDEVVKLRNYLAKTGLYAAAFILVITIAIYILR